MSVITTELPLVRSTTSTTATGAAFREHLQAMAAEPARAQVLLLVADELHPDGLASFRAQQEERAIDPVELDVRQQVREHLAAYLRALVSGDLSAWPDERVGQLWGTDTVHGFAPLTSIATACSALLPSTHQDPVVSVPIGSYRNLLESLFPGDITPLGFVPADEIVTATAVIDMWWHPAQVRLARTFVHATLDDIMTNRPAALKVVTALAPAHRARMLFRGNSETAEGSAMLKELMKLYTESRLGD